MKFETLGNNKKILLGTVIVFVVILTLIISTSLAKYKVTESINIASGTINYSPSDLSIMGIYLEGDNGYTQSDTIPESGYVLNSEESYCKVGDSNVDVAISYDINTKMLTISPMTSKGMKCFLYFDKVLNAQSIIANSTISTRSSFTSAITASSTGVLYSTEDDDGTSYYYAGAATDNYVYFAGFYWRIVRINGDGTIRLIYAGTSAVENGTSSSDTQISTSKFNPSYDDNTYVGYMYGTADTWVDGGISDHTVDWWTSTSKSYYYAKSYSFNTTTGEYSLSGTKTSGVLSEDFVGYLTCFNTYSTKTCATLYYISEVEDEMSAKVYTYERTGSGNITYANAHANNNNSTIKGVLDSWYTSNLASYSDYISNDAGFCGDRTSYLWNSSTYVSGYETGKTETVYGAYIRLVNKKAPSLKCTNSSDLYTTSTSSKGNKSLTYPIGLITSDEVVYAGGKSSTSNSSYYLYTGQDYWTISPYQFNGGGHAHNFHINSSGTLTGSSDYVTATKGVRPVINLRADTEFKSGTLGTAASPYEVV